MQRLKINWKFSILKVGFLFLCALFLATLSFYVFLCKSYSQKIVVIIIALYLLVLLIKKYSNFAVLSLILILFLSSAWLDKSKSQEINLNEQTMLKIYPDQVNIKDGWISGIGYFKKQKVLFSGNINSEQEQIIKSGNTLIMSEITGEIGKIMPATNLGEFDYQKYYASKNIYQQVKFKHCNLILAKKNISTQLHYWRYCLKQYFNAMPRLLGFFASELILAENNSSNNQEVIDNYRDLGVIHLLSISGLHVGIYTLVISFIGYWLKFTEEETFGCCLIILLIFIFLSGYQAGFIRASLTYILGKICKFRDLKISGIDLLGTTCLIHLCFIPNLFMGIGAILSYVLALGLQLTNNMKAIKQSILLNLLLSPLLLYYFFQVNILTIFFNMLVVPYFNYVVMPVSFINIVLFKICPGISDGLENILNNFEMIIGQVSKTKIGLLTFGRINWWQCLVLLLVTLFLLAYLNEKRQIKKIKIEVASILTSIYIAFFIVIHFPLQGQVTFIDVGQGDSILITTPFPRKVYMIDTGGKLNFSGKKQTPQLNRITIPLLKAQGISKIDGLFVSHQDADHVGDIRPLLEQVKVKKLYMAQGLINNQSFKRRIDGVIKKTELIELLAGMQVKEPKINFQIVYPFKPGEGKNEDSLSILFELAHRKWLFTGDLGQDGEKEIMERYPFQVDYFKLGHHGSKTSSNVDFLKSINPKLVFISAGRNNRFGHPHQETISNLKSLQIPYVSTQDCGMISWYYGHFSRPKFQRFLKEGIE